MTCVKSSSGRTIGASIILESMTAPMIAVIGVVFAFAGTNVTRSPTDQPRSLAVVSWTATCPWDRVSSERGAR